MRWLSTKQLGMRQGILFALVLLYQPVTLTAAEDTFSPANTALFASNQMKDVKTGDKLVYDFVQSGTMAEAVKDTITLNLASKDGKPEAVVEYFTGERNRWVPPFQAPTGNPVLMLFLQSDINEMERVNGGQWRHYQKYIKLALEKDTPLADATFEYAGSVRQGKKIVIQPYVDDPEKGRFNNQAYTRKQYEFILSDAVPGGIYKISADVPGESPDKPLAHKELLLH